MIRNKVIEIPEEHKEICRKFVLVARALGLKKLSGKFKTNDDWGADVNFSWEMGRHESEGEIKITSEFWTSTQETVNYDEGKNG